MPYRRLDFQIWVRARQRLVAQSTSDNNQRHCLTAFVIASTMALISLIGLLAAIVGVWATPPGFVREAVLRQAGKDAISIKFFDDGRMLYAQRTGVIQIFDTKKVPFVGETFYTASDVTFDAEKGLLDIEIDPDVQKGHSFVYLYVSQVAPFKAFRVIKVKYNHNGGGTKSRGGEAETIWTDEDGLKAAFHYGGSLVFGPDKLLYLTSGDHQNHQATQRIDRSAGKVHRFDRNGNAPDTNMGKRLFGQESVWVMGLRNGFRASWDLQTERLFIGEVGGNVQKTAWEDIHVLRPDDNDINLGWPFCEGDCTNPDFPECDCAKYMNPIYAWKHEGRHSGIVGGVVYRGSDFPKKYEGAYFYGDYPRQMVFAIKFDDSNNVIFREEWEPDKTAERLISFAQDKVSALIVALCRRV